MEQFYHLRRDVGMGELLRKPAYHAKWHTRLKWPEISRLREQRLREKVIGHPVLSDLYHQVRQSCFPVAKDVDYAQAAVTIGQRTEVSNTEFDALGRLLRAFAPWKKGPFSIFGHEIDAEWRSDYKWSRIVEHLPSLRGKCVADIGCSNGYFMFRMLEHEPEHILGMDPYAKAWLKFELLKKLSDTRNIDFELLGAEHAELFPQCFDVVFCLGVLYHHTDPMQLLRSIYKSMKKDATLIVECQGIPGELPVALTPRQRFARARGIWFLPTESCLYNWLSRAQFRDIQCFYNAPLSVEEQRRTDWADVDSLSDFLSKDDPCRTIEGYPAPVRIYFKAKK